MIRKVLVGVLAGMLAVTTPVWAEGKEYRKGQAFCPAHVLVVGNVVVQSGRCYVLAVLRESRGTFLAFLTPSARIPANRTIRLGDDEGREIRSKIVYLVPIQATALSAVVIPVNTIRLVQIREEDRHEDEDNNENNQENRKGQDQVVLIITGIPIPNLSVTFVVRF